MLDIKKLREDFEGIRERVEYRGKGDFGINNIKKFDEERRSILAEVEAMKHRQNTVSREIPKLKKAGEDTSEIMAEMKTLSGKIKELSGKLSEIEENLKDALLNVPNTPAEGVPFGKDDEDNVEVRKFGEPAKFQFEPKAHWDIGEDLDIVDFVTIECTLHTNLFDIFLFSTSRKSCRCQIYRLQGLRSKAGESNCMLYARFTHYRTRLYRDYTAVYG